LIRGSRSWNAQLASAVRLDFEDVLEGWIEDAVEVIESIKVFQGDGAT
jgi:hypothetical protein